MCKHLEKASDKASRTACLSCTGLQKYKYSCIFCKLATVYNLDIVKYNLRKAHVIIWWLSRYSLVYNCFQVATISVLQGPSSPSILVTASNWEQCCTIVYPIWLCKMLFRSASHLQLTQIWQWVQPAENCFYTAICSGPQIILRKSNLLSLNNLFGYCFRISSKT